jgi:hypothetical protein
MVMDASGPGPTPVADGHMIMLNQSCDDIDCSRHILDMLYGFQVVQRSIMTGQNYTSENITYVNKGKAQQISPVVAATRTQKQSMTWGDVFQQFISNSKSSRAMEQHGLR